MPKIDEQKLIESAQSGNHDAYTQLVQLHHVRVRGFCRSLLSHTADADDAAQEVFIKAYRGINRFRGEASFSSWLYRIAANHCKDVLRKRMRQKTDSWDALVEKGGDQVEALAATEDPQHKSGVDAELMLQALKTVSADYRQILLLREVEGLRYDELQLALGCSLDAVKGRLKRARQALSMGWRHLSDKESV